MNWADKTIKTLRGKKQGWSELGCPTVHHTQTCKKKTAFASKKIYKLLGNSFFMAMYPWISSLVKKGNIGHPIQDWQTERLVLLRFVWGLNSCFQVVITAGKNSRKEHYWQVFRIFERLYHGLSEISCTLKVRYHEKRVEEGNLHLRPKKYTKKSFCWIESSDGINTFHTISLLKNYLLGHWYTVRWESMINCAHIL